MHARMHAGSSRELMTPCPDHTWQLKLLEAKLGVLGMLDEECALPKGSEEAYVEKMHASFSGHDAVPYAKPTRGHGNKAKPKPKPGERAVKDFDKLQFAITHYAGQVIYTATWPACPHAGMPACLPAGGQAGRQAGHVTSLGRTAGHVHG